MNREFRKNALHWWKMLPDEQKVSLVKKHFPNIPHIALVTTSSSKIEQIWMYEGMK